MSGLVRILCYSGLLIGSDYLPNLPGEVSTSTSSKQKPWAVVMSWAPQSLPVATCGVLEALALWSWSFPCLHFYQPYILVTTSLQAVFLVACIVPAVFYPPFKQKAQKGKLKYGGVNCKCQMPHVPRKLGVLFPWMAFHDVCSSNASRSSFFSWKSTLLDCCIFH